MNNIMGKCIHVCAYCTVVYQKVIFMNDLSTYILFTFKFHKNSVTNSSICEIHANILPQKIISCFRKEVSSSMMFC